jgi:hypothetical protein
MECPITASISQARADPDFDEVIRNVITAHPRVVEVTDIPS